MVACELPRTGLTGPRGLSQSCVPKWELVTVQGLLTYPVFSLTVMANVSPVTQFLPLSFGRILHSLRAQHFLVVILWGPLGSVMPPSAALSPMVTSIVGGVWKFGR